MGGLMGVYETDRFPFLLRETKLIGGFPEGSEADSWRLPGEPSCLRQSLDRRLRGEQRKKSDGSRSS